MINARLLLPLALSIALLAKTVCASDVYVIQGLALGPPINGCDTYQWLGDAIFHNSTASAKTIRLLDISNGPLVGGTDATLVIDAGRTSSINASRVWVPNPETAPWVLHLDVPDGVLVESRFEIGFVSCLPAERRPRYGKLSFPVYRALQPAGVVKVHVGTDLASINARNNVAIFNAGAVAASGHVEVHQGCDDALLHTIDVTIPANTVRQFALGTAQTSCPNLPVQGTTFDWVTYVTVTVDQPSLSWISTIANRDDLTVPYTVSNSQ